MLARLPRKIDKKSHRENEGKRSPGHRNFVRGHECCVPGCTRRPIEVAHVRSGTSGGMGFKPSDRWCVSLCGGPEGHHAEQHRLGERSFEQKYAINLHDLAEAFVKASPHRAKLEAMP